MIQSIDIPPSETKPCGKTLNQILRGSPGAYSFPAGTYLIEETLRVPSGTHLVLDPHAVFRLADGAAQGSEDYLLTNADPKGGDQDITIEGGTFDGNQVGNPRPEGLFTEGYTGAMLHFQNVKGLKLQNLTFTNAEAYYSRFTHVHDFHIVNITFDSDKVRHNNDGIHLGGHCSHGVIRNLRAMTPRVTGDDLVALNADDALTRNEVRGMTNGPITDLLIENLEAHSCHTFVRLLSTVSPIRNITIRNLRGGCQNAAVNADGARGCRVPVFDETHPPTPDGIGLLENIHISDLVVHKMHETSTTALIDLQERMKTFTVEKFHRDLTKDQHPKTPTLRLRHIQVREGLLDEQTLSPLNLLDRENAFERNPERFQKLTITTGMKPKC